MSKQSDTTTISRATLFVLTLVTLIVVCVPTCILTKLYLDEKDKVETLEDSILNDSSNNNDKLKVTDEEDGIPTQAYTLWWVIFNEPDQCINANTAAEESAPKCGKIDVFGPEFLESVKNGSPDPSLITSNTLAGTAMLYGTGGLNDNQTGNLRLQASIYESPVTDLVLDPVMDPLKLGITLTNAANAEIHLVIRNHGKYMFDDNQTLGPKDIYCDLPSMNYYGPQNPDGRICYDTQAAIYTSGEEGEKNLFFMGTNDTELTQDGYAKLYRRGESIQVILNSNTLEHPTSSN